MKWYQTVWAKIKIFGTELVNIATNILCPIMAMFCAIAELLQLPATAINALKDAEYWLFDACGTAGKIVQLVAETENKIAENKK